MDDGYNMLTIPLVQDKHDLGLYGSRNMLVFKDKAKGNKLTYAVVEAFGEKEYLKANNYQFNSRNFTGTLLLHDWDKGFETGFVMKDGQPVALVKDLQELDEHGDVVKAEPGKAESTRKANCIITIYEKCYGTKYQDANGQWIYSAATCFIDRTERSPGCEGSYWPIWKNYVDFATPSTGETAMIQKIDYLQGKLTISWSSRPCIHHIVDRIMNHSNPLHRIGQILEASGLSYDFYKFVSDLTNPNTNYKIYIEEQNINSNVNYAGHSVYHPSDGRVVIQLNSVYLNSATDLSIARTIVHELIHAYLYVGMSNPTVYGQSFSAVNNYLMYYSYGNQPQAHHQLMADRYTSTISNMIHNYIDATGTSIPIGSPYVASTVQQYTSLLSWAGLYNTSAFSNLPETEKQKIRTAVDNERLNTQHASNKKNC